MRIEAATRMQTLSTQFFAGLSARIAALEAQGNRVIRLDIGSPDLPPPSPILDALYRSANRSDTHGYQPHRGSEALLNAWSYMYRSAYGVEIDPKSEVVPLLGSKEGIFHFVQAFVNPGDVVLIPDPGYLTYEAAARFAGGEVYRMPLLPENNFLPDFEAIPAEVARRAKLMWLNYPNNPTAATATREFFERAVEFAKGYQILVCHDAAYSQVTFDGYRSPSIFEVDREKEVAIEFNTLSKSHNMAGWRVGAALGNAETLKTLYTLKTQVDSGHFRPILDAAVQAMTGDQGWLQERNQVYQRRRDLIVDALRRVGVEVRVPLASLYVWMPLPSGWKSEEFCQRLLEEAHVSITPGTVFGKYGEGSARICFCLADDLIVEAMERLTQWMKKL
ncbi:MAG: aminotransferase class I/II-fold pyridoxal phosphate-dependent enzyme [Anaerolineales bacterium]|nr:aminotransferase class I/II-fold pyridoxal phosphate-dependent enzyme [Anaerolineales bacterium]MDW8160670.1 aminotransferase class I/II-fold pyridoxal phosphate-dependent enzyme [Anaerolineales bacterium]